MEEWTVGSGQEKLPPVRNVKVGRGGFWPKEKRGWESSWVDVYLREFSDTTQYFFSVVSTPAAL